MGHMHIIQVSKGLNCHQFWGRGKQVLNTVQCLEKYVLEKICTNHKCWKNVTEYARNESIICNVYHR